MDRIDEARQTLLELLGEDGQRPVEEIVAALTWVEFGELPLRPLVVMLARPDEFREPLLAELARSPEALARLMEDAPDERHLYYLHTFALYVLAAQGEPRAFRPVLDFLAADSHLAADLLAEVVTEDLHVILARTWDGSDLDRLKAIIEDYDADIGVRGACLRSLHSLVRMGKLPRESVVAYYDDIAERLRVPENADFTEELVAGLAYMQEPDLRTAIARWLGADWAEGVLLDEDDIDSIYEMDVESLDELLVSYERFHNLTDYVAQWAWFNGGDPADYDDPWDGLDVEAAAAAPDEDKDEGWLAPQPIVRAGRKIGRNEPCLCGSGKKYKKCCLADDAR